MTCPLKKNMLFYLRPYRIGNMNNFRLYSKIDFLPFMKNNYLFIK